MRPKNRIPSHPGEILLEEFLVPLGVTQVAFAAHIGVPARRVYEIVRGRRGDASGESILISMLARAKLPGMDDPVLGEKYLIEEQVAVCEVLGKFDTDTSRAALQKATKSPHEAVRKAAEASLKT